MPEMFQAWSKIFSQVRDRSAMLEIFRGMPKSFGVCSKVFVYGRDLSAMYEIFWASVIGQARSIESYRSSSIEVFRSNS